MIPRLFIGPVAWLVYRALKSMNEQVRLIAAAVAGTLTNTILVIGAISLRLGVPFFPTLASVAINVILEIIVASVITVAVVNAHPRHGQRQGRLDGVMAPASGKRRGIRSGGWLKTPSFIGKRCSAGPCAPTLNLRTTLAAFHPFPARRAARCARAA